MHQRTLSLKMEKLQKPMMRINVRSSNSTKHLLLTVSLTVCSAMGPVSCPRSIDDLSSKHIMNNVSVFDGPPKNMMDLIGGGNDAHGMWRWDAKYIDPYLICRYKDTNKTVALHAVGATYCAYGLKPDRAYCK